MTERINAAQAAPEAYRAMSAMERYVHTTSIDHSLIHLVKMRASYINGCAYCIDMHSKDARAAGETEQRLYAVPVWRETPFFTPRERAALAFTEAVTLISNGGVPDDVFAAAREHFDDRALVELAMVIVTINGWNRLAVTFHADVGTYQPKQPAKAGNG
jgi:AhpD family alkylhydroperoxidase